MKGNDILILALIVGGIWLLTSSQSQPVAVSTAGLLPNATGQLSNPANAGIATIAPAVKVTGLEGLGLAPAPPLIRP